MMCLTGRKAFFLATLVELDVGGIGRECAQQMNASHPVTCMGGVVRPRRACLWHQARHKLRQQR